MTAKTSIGECFQEIRRLAGQLQRRWCRGRTAEYSWLPRWESQQ